MYLEDYVLADDEKIIELPFAKPVYDPHEIFLLSKCVFISPSVERIKSGFRVYGPPIDPGLPWFSIDFYPKRGKLVVNIQGDAIPLRYRVEIEKIVSDNFLSFKN